ERRRASMTLPVHEFLRRFLQHVLPEGLHRVRAFGLLHAAHRSLLRRLQLLLAPRPAPEPAVSERPARALLRCPSCGAPSLRIVHRLSPAECIARVTAETAASETARAPPGADGEA